MGEAEEFVAGLPLTSESPCPYFADRGHRVRYLAADETISPAAQARLLQAGFRRCAHVYYRPECRGCRQCLSYRVAPASFKPSRQQRRVQRRNRDVTFSLRRPQPNEDKQELYLRYEYQQHHCRPAPSGPAPGTFDPERQLETMAVQMYAAPRTSRELEIRSDGRLLGFGIVDIARTASSLVYFVFDPAFARRSPGTLNILWNLAYAAEHHMDHVYLGYCIPGHPKMAYKSRFGPAEIRDPTTGAWREVPRLALLDDERNDASC